MANEKTSLQSTLGRLEQINVSPQGGVPKLPIESTRIEFDHVEGDKQNNVKFHGGPQRAVCLYSFELIEELQREGHPIAPGTTGENLTISGLDWNTIEPGVRLHIGSEVVLEIASYTRPCHKIRASFHDEEFMRLWQKTHPGWSRLYAKVLCTGLVTKGDAVRVLESL